jgi:hypothetical protein
VTTRDTFSGDEMSVGLVGADSRAVSGALAEGSLTLPPTSLV